MSFFLQCTITRDAFVDVSPTNKLTVCYALKDASVIIMTFAYTIKRTMDWHKNGCVLINSQSSECSIYISSLILEFLRLLPLTSIFIIHEAIVPTEVANLSWISSVKRRVGMEHLQPFGQIMAVCKSAIYSIRFEYPFYY